MIHHGGAYYPTNADGTPGPHGGAVIRLAAAPTDLEVLGATSGLLGDAVDGAGRGGPHRLIGRRGISSPVLLLAGFRVVLDFLARGFRLLADLGAGVFANPLQGG